MSNLIDLSGTLNIQRQYLSDLSNLANTNDVSTYFSDIQTQLNNLYGTLVKNNVSINDILTDQTDMNNIVQNEAKRLQQKKANMDNAIYNQKRFIQLNESYKKRYWQYVKMVITIVIVILLYLGIILIQKFFPFIPGAVINLLYVLIFSIGIIYIVGIYYDIYRRNKMNFDEINYNPPNTSLGTSAIDSSGNLNMNIGLCFDQECCSTGTVWDDTTYTCVSSNGYSSPSSSLTYPSPTHYSTPSNTKY